MFAQAQRGSAPHHNVGAGVSRSAGFGADGSMPAAMRASPDRGNLNRYADLATDYRQGPLAQAMASADRLRASQRADAASARPVGPLQSLLSRGAGPGIQSAAGAMREDFQRNQALAQGQQAALGNLFQTASAFEQPEARNVERMVGLRDTLHNMEKAKFDAWMKKRASDALAAAAAPRRQKFLGIF